MELIIIASAVILVFGAMIIAIALSPGSARPVSQPQPASEEVPAADSEASAAQPVVEQPATPPSATAHSVTPQPIADQPVAAEPAESQSAEISESPAAPLSPATTPSVSVAERDDASTLPLNPLQLKAAEIVSLQVDRLQAEYMRMGEERERLAQGWLPGG